MVATAGSTLITSKKYTNDQSSEWLESLFITDSANEHE